MMWYITELSWVKYLTIFLSIMMTQYCRIDRRKHGAEPSSYNIIDQEPNEQ